MYATNIVVHYCCITPLPNIFATCATWVTSVKVTHMQSNIHQWVAGQYWWCSYNLLLNHSLKGAYTILTIHAYVMY